MPKKSNEQTPEEIEQIYTNALSLLKERKLEEAKDEFIKYLEIIEKKFKGQKVYSPSNGLEASLLSEDQETLFTNYHASDAYFYIGNILFEQDDLVEARKYLGYALKWNPYDCRARFEEAESYKIVGNHTKFHDLNEKTYDYLYHPEDYARYLRNLGYYYIEQGEFRLAECIYLYSIQYDESKGVEIMNELNYVSSISEHKDLPDKKEIIETLDKHQINIFIPHKNISKIFELYEEYKDENSSLTQLLKELIDFYNEFFV